MVMSLIIDLQFSFLIKILFLDRFPNKDAQYHFFRNYLQPDKPHEVFIKCQIHTFIKQPINIII